MGETMDQLLTAEFKEAFDEFDKVQIGNYLFINIEIHYGYQN